MRDEFSQRTKLTLALRAGFKCSNPDCGMLTIGPAQDNNKSVNVGVAAHICAASKGGPRYDDVMTPEERKGIDNGIWLCQTHACLIDKDPTRYPKELLRQWKSASEEKARKGLTDWKPANSVEVIEEDKKIMQVLILTFEDEDTISLLNHDFHGKFPRKWRRPLDDLSEFYHLFSSKPGHKVLRALTDRLMNSVDNLICHLKVNSFTSKDWINDNTYCIEDEDDMLCCNGMCSLIWKEYEYLIETYIKILHKAEN